VILWDCLALAMKLELEQKFGPGGIRWKGLQRGLVFQERDCVSMIGSAFAARVHRYSSVIWKQGLVGFCGSPRLFSLSVEFVGCAVRIAVIEFPGSVRGRRRESPACLPRRELGRNISPPSTARSPNNEPPRESSVEFKRPGPSPWRYAQDWAQACGGFAPTVCLCRRTRPNTTPPEPAGLCVVCLGPWRWVALAATARHSRSRTCHGAAARDSLSRRGGTGQPGASGLRAPDRGVEGAWRCGGARAMICAPTCNALLRLAQATIRKPAHLLSALVDKTQLRRLLCRSMGSCGDWAMAGSW